ncbi:serine/threonine-protein kinase TNNI3K-like isoform X1 [Halichondria panicea]|uniref:serine/threonine-protein kinase TNNI3K-like isoform X1 n=1 Tax=Halichondria panicea TaxID=6063 RepID=UPI00312B6EA3
MAEMSEVDLDALVVQVEGLGLEENKVGSGAYGIVFKVTVNGKKCIAKKLHNILLQADNYYPHAPTQQREFIVRKFRKECCILKSLDDPNVVSFEGVHYGHDKNDISLIMERLHSDLADFVKKNPSTNLATRIHILYDVSKGLRYLHSLTPPLIHRDLTAPNILLTEDLTAKIGDLGVSRYVDPTVPTILSTNPGHLFYMSPESQEENPVYTTKLDIFSFGNLIIHTVIGDLPKVYRISASDPNEALYKREGKIELMRRNTSVHVKMGEDHTLYPLVVRCLHDQPEQRPAVEEVSSSLRELCHRHPRMSFLEACKAGNVGVVQELLDGGADPNQADENNRTVVRWASYNGHDEVVRVLIRAGANVNTLDKDGDSPLYTASFSGHQKCVQLLCLWPSCDINIYFACSYQTKELFLVH